MAPRNTKQGASANARRTSNARGSRTAASSKTRSRSTASKTPSSRAGKTTRVARKPATSNRRAPKHVPARREQLSGRRWLVPTAAAAVILMFAWGYYPVAAVQYRESRERSRLAAELESVQARNDRLRAQVERLKTPAGVEDYARSQLGLVKKGENVVVVVDGTETKEGSASATPPEIDSALTPDETGGAWTAFLDLVFGVE